MSVGPGVGPIGEGDSESGRYPSEALIPILEAADRLTEVEDWNGLAELFRDALERHPGDPFVLCGLGVAERELGLDGVAYERFRECVAAGPLDPHILAIAGNALASFDDPQAEGALRTAALLGPDLALARWMNGAYLAREGLFEEALRELGAAREIDPEDPTISYELGVARGLAGDPDGAAEELFQAVQLDPHDGWARVVLGLALLEADRLEEALGELVEGARSRPQDSGAQLLAALAAAAGGDEDLAWEMIERARVDAGGDEVAMVEAVEERIADGAEAARDFLVNELSPSAYRERLSERP
jgi:tetratricopeptide (TPR) repeat protein